MKERHAGKVVVVVAGSFCLLTSSCGRHVELADSTATDIDGNRYRTVQIGTQVWMAENLRVTRSSRGKSVISYSPDGDTSNVPSYGRLYDWQTALRISPRGWHIPSDEEWRVLEEHLGAVGAAKLRDTILWCTSRRSGTNETGFSARPAGYWNESGFDNRFGFTAVFWSSTQSDSHFVWSRTLSADHDTVRRARQHPQYGFSVRCVKDAE